MDVYLELGTKRVFAGALDWPGLCRTARDQEGAMTALLAYGPRYAGVLTAAGVRPRFAAPKRLSDLVVAEWLEGNATTDFGAPAIASAADALPVKPADRRKLSAVLEACWAALDRAASGAAGVELARGPRGGGRELDGILAHVIGAEAGYVGKIGLRLAGPTAGSQSPAAHRGNVLAGLTQAATVGVPLSGPRGGAMWSPRYFVRRAAWHVLDHAWEIEDRSGMVSA